MRPASTPFASFLARRAALVSLGSVLSLGSLSACSDREEGADVDAAVEHRDAGVSGLDSGLSPSDAGSRPDAFVASDAGPPRDAGPDSGAPRDAGLRPDAGRVDAGLDGGMRIDAGRDAGAPVDAGSDAGPADAGPPDLHAGLIGLWNFDETALDTIDGSRDFRDQSGGGNHGTALGATAVGASGILSRSIGLDGTSAYVSIADAPSLRPARVTLAAWFVLADAPPAEHGVTILTKSQRAAPWTHPFLSWMIRIDTLTVVEASFGSSGTYTAPFTVPELAVGSWHHVALSYDGVNVRCYIDGASVGSHPFAGPIAYDAYPLVVGGDFGAAPVTDYFQGNVDQVAIWNRALNDGEVALLYNGGAGTTLP